MTTNPDFLNSSEHVSASKKRFPDFDFLDNKLLSGKNQTSFYSEARQQMAKITFEPGNSGVGLIPIFIIFTVTCGILFTY